MEITGKVVAVLELTSGTGKNGNEWKKIDFVIETADEKFPKKVCFTLFGDKVNTCPMIEAMVTVSFDINAHEYNGKWFNSINAWKVDPASPATNATVQAAPQATNPSPAVTAQSAVTAAQPVETKPQTDSAGSDLPF